MVSIWRWNRGGHLSLHKCNVCLVKDIFNFVALFQTLNANCEIKMYVPFPFMVRKKYLGILYSRGGLSCIPLSELLGTKRGL